MLQIKTFTFNTFQENTYVLHDDTQECIIVDPGCYEIAEQDELKNYITLHKLTPVKLLNTHTHVDHVLGNAFVFRDWGLKPSIHRMDLPILHAIPSYSSNYGLDYEESPEPELFLEEEDIIRFGQTELKVLFTPGHSPGSISFYSQNDGFVIAGDVLFYRSIGRTDLTGGNYETLIHSIKSKLMPLPDDTKVYSGHGPTTTIISEKKYNPFLNE